MRARIDASAGMIRGTAARRKAPAVLPTRRPPRGATPQRVPQSSTVWRSSSVWRRAPARGAKARDTWRKARDTWRKAPALRIIPGQRPMPVVSRLHAKGAIDEPKRLRLLVPGAVLLLCLLWVGVHAQAPSRPRPAAAAGAAAAAAAWPGTGTRRPAGAFAASADQPLRRPVARAVPLPLDRAGEHGRAHRRLRRRRTPTRPPSTSGSRRAASGRRRTTARRGRRSSTRYSVCSIGALAVDQKNPNMLWVGHGRGEQPAELLVRRRHLQVDRRRQDVRATSG